MPTLIPQPTIVAPAGNKPKRIEVAICLPAFSPATVHRDA
jgi:hypothetical protein